MSINLTEIGKAFIYATDRDGEGFDMSASTALTLKFEHNDGVTNFTATNPDVTAPAVPLGDLNANEYMQYITTGSDFTKDGSWSVCGIYEDATPKKFIGDKVTFTVGESC